MARSTHGRIGPSAGAARRHRADASNGDAASASVRIYLRRLAHHHGADGEGWSRARWFNGDRHTASRALESPTAALQLFQAAIRAGDKSAHRLHPRRTDYVERDDDWK